MLEAATGNIKRENRQHSFRHPHTNQYCSFDHTRKKLHSDPIQACNFDHTRTKMQSYTQQQSSFSSFNPNRNQLPSQYANLSQMPDRKPVRRSHTLKETVTTGAKLASVGTSSRRRAPSADANGYVPYRPRRDSKVRPPSSSSRNSNSSRTLGLLNHEGPNATTSRPGTAASTYASELCDSHFDNVGPSNQLHLPERPDRSILQAGRSLAATS